MDGRTTHAARGRKPQECDSRSLDRAALQLVGLDGVVRILSCFLSQFVVFRSPAKALNAATSRRSSFAPEDLAQFLTRNTPPLQQIWYLFELAQCRGFAVGPYLAMKRHCALCDGNQIVETLFVRDRFRRRQPAAGISPSQIQPRAHQSCGGKGLSGDGRFERLRLPSFAGVVWYARGRPYTRARLLFRRVNSITSANFI